jgi:hypothetical protein
LQAGHDARNSAFNHVEDQLGVDRVGRTEVVRTVRDLSAWAVVDGVLYGERDGRVTAVRSQDRTVLWQAPPPFECADVTQTLVVARVVIATITYACSETGMDSFEGVYGFDRSTAGCSGGAR